MDSDFQLFKEGSKDSQTVIISFSGYRELSGGITPFEFLNILTRISPEPDKYFFKDPYKNWYHKGIFEGVEQFATYLKNITNKYQRIVFMGASMGGYAAILFGSLVPAHCVLAFNPQTNLKICCPNVYVSSLESFDSEYLDIKTHINANTTYKIYGTEIPSERVAILHAKDHCENLRKYKNVEITYFANASLKRLRNEGVLDKIITSCL
jgi:hypothetical protein